MSNKTTLSRRGADIVHTELRPDFKVYFEAKENQWDKKSNPGGKFPLNMAENNLCWGMLKERAQKILSKNDIPDWVSNYTGISGSDTFLSAVAAFMSTHLAKCKVKPENLIASAGATAVLEVCSWALCNEGDVAVIPAPGYPVYTQDIHNKAQVDRYDLVTHQSIDEIKDGSPLNIEHLEKANREINRSGKVFKMLILTSPDNPTGCIYPKSQLKEIAAWCHNNRVHLIVNELYGLSLINQKNKKIRSNYSSHIKFKSFVQIIEALKSPYLHHVYGLSKDLGASGFRVGMVYSLNEEFLAAYKNLNAPHMVSNLTQWLFEQILSDKKFMRDYIKTNQEKLTSSYAIVINSLRKLGIPYSPAYGSLFVWMDLSEFLNDQSPQGEYDLWMELYEKYDLLITPTNGFGSAGKGQYRLVYSFMKQKSMKEAMRRFKRFVKDKRKR